MKRRVGVPWAFVAALAMAAAPPATAAPEPEPGTQAALEPPAQSWRDRPQLTGDWGGWRTSLAEHGVEFRASYLAGLWSNVHGGLQTGTRYEGFVAWGLEADLELLVGWKGGSFQIDGYSYHGGQPSEDLVGTFPTQNLSAWETATSIRFFEIFLRQTWSNGRFLFKVGQLAADHDFFLSEQSATLLNATFGFLGLGRGLAIGPFYPLAAPGAYFRARTADERWEFELGAYTADPGEDVSSNHGFDWSFDDGAFLIGELRTRRSPWGRRGSYALGVVATTSKLQRFENGRSVRGTYGLYGEIDQTLVAPTTARPGLGLFLRGLGTPLPDRTFVQWTVDVGLSVTRPFPGRGKDVASLGFAYLGFSSDYLASERAKGEDVSSHQAVLELTYRLQLTGWLTLQPDLQLFFDPHFSRQDATVLGLRAVIDF